MKISLVAFDLDGTLVGRNLVISPRVIGAVERMEAAGVRGCIVTGRMFAATLHYVRQLHFTMPVVCYQGAAIFDPKSGATIFEQPVDHDIVHNLIAYAQRSELHLQLYKDDHYFVEHENANSALYARLAGVGPVVVDSLAQEFAHRGATKALIVTEPNDAKRVAEELTTILGHRAYVTRSYPEFVEILNPAVDKGRAFAFVAKSVGIDLEETMAIGDSWNDRPLLQASGFAVAMGNAPHELLDIAQAQVGDVSEDGVAQAIERYVLRALV